MGIVERDVWRVHVVPCTRKGLHGISRKPVHDWTPL